RPWPIKCADDRDNGCGGRSQTAARQQLTLSTRGHIHRCADSLFFWSGFRWNTSQITRTTSDTTHNSAHTFPKTNTKTADGENGESVCRFKSEEMIPLTHKRVR